MSEWRARRWRRRIVLTWLLAGGSFVATWPDGPANASEGGWERRQGIPDGYILSMASSGDGFVAGGQRGIWFSTDGYEWEQALGTDEFPDPTSSFQSGGVIDVAVGGPGFVAVGQALPSTGDRVVAAVWTSPDGRTWTRVESTVFEEGTAPIPEGVSTVQTSISAVASGSAGLVAVGSVFTGKFVEGQLITPCCTPVVWTSSDGAVWARHPIEESRGYGPAGVADITSTKDGYVAVGEDGGHPSAWRSPDGVAWRQLPLDPATGGFAAVAATGGDVVVVGSTNESAGEHGRGRASIWALEQGSRCKLRAAARPARITAFADVVATDDGFVAVGWRGRYEVTVDALVWTSSNGRSWQAVRQSGGVFAERTILNGVVARNDRVIGFGQASSGSGTDDDPFRHADVFWERPAGG